MSDTNSIWTNGIQKDADGYAVFYPMGTNKVEIPKNSPHWPKGNKLIGQFVYKDDKLVGFCDTKAMTSTNNGEIIVMPYEYIDTEFDSIEKDSIQIHAPKATYKKASWSGGVEKIDIPDVEYKYKGCKNVNDIKVKDENYLENDIKDGKWTELLSDLTNSNGMFQNNENLVIFDSDLSSLGFGNVMFRDCYNLTTFTSDLSSLTDSGNMFSSCLKLSEFEGDLSSLTAGWNMFYECSNLTTFTTDLPSLTNGNYMFSNCSNLEYFDSDLKSLTICTGMFMNCVKLTTFISNLSSLITGNSMFQNCSNLTTFTSDLSSLTNGNSMFGGCTNLKSFEAELKSLDTASYMFINCGQLSSFTSDLTFLTNGTSMFQGCSGITTFKSNLKSLTNGTNMFNGCKLDTSSLKNIAETINTVSNLSNIHIGIGNKTPTEEENIHLTQIHNKGWQVYVNGSGSAYVPTDGTSLIPIDGEQNLNPIPFWAKPVPATEEDANYIDENGNFFNILGGQFIYVNDPESYGMFISEEDAAANMRLTRIVNE